MPSFTFDYWPLIAGASTLLLALGVSSHIVLSKRDTRAAAGWVGIVWLVPFLGSILYFVLGINRIQRRATARRVAPGPVSNLDALVSTSPSDPLPGELDDLRHLVGDVTGAELEGGNRITELVGGTEAYAAMLDAIDTATTSVSLTTYILNNDAVGQRFVDRLGAAVQRGVEVRVIVDAVGARYSIPRVIPSLRRRGVSCALFMPTRFPWRFRYLNLRSHRKIAVVDGRLGFTGGLNIREECERTDSRRVEDLHFSLEGPVVAQLQRCFVDDWVFASGESLDGPAWFPELEANGDIHARGVPDGPDEDIDKLHWTLLGALSAARRSVLIVNPYFLPDSTLCAAINVCAMRGVSVDIVVPEKSNLLLVRWATNNVLQHLREPVRIWMSPPPFDHSKLMVVDGLWALIGSANWDARSLRLNFELNVECYDSLFAARMEQLVAAKIQKSRRVTPQSLATRPVLTRLRDGVVGLLTPYL